MVCWILDMPTGTMKRLFAESSSSSSSGSGSGGGREVEPATAVLCAPRPRRAQVQPCSADLILGPRPFLNPTGNSKQQRDFKNAEREEEDVGWTVFGGSPPARADNPLVNDPHFLLNQRHPVPPSDLSIFDHHGRGNHGHLPTYSNSNSSSSSSSSSFAPSYAPAVRIQGFDVASCRSSHGSNGGGRVLSARA